MQYLEKTQIDAVFRLLGERLQSDNLGPFRIVICGGASLISMSLVSRATSDVDVVALMSEENLLISPDPLPQDLEETAKIVADDMDLDEHWLNTGPKDIFQMGLPEGFLQRLIERKHGSHLSVYFASRLDQIHFKVYAAVDQGPGKHLTDLQSLDPTDIELEQAVKWVITHNTSEAFHSTLKTMLVQIGYEDVAGRI